MKNIMVIFRTRPEATKRIINENLNPVKRETSSTIFKDEERVHRIEPLDVVNFHNFLARLYLTLTNSGGIQEESPSFGKPVLVMRDTTEMPEGINAEMIKLVGTDENTIYNEFNRLLVDKEEYERMSKSSNPYGDGFASNKIVDILEGKQGKKYGLYDIDSCPCI